MSRPFNLADAKAGHPVASSTGADIEVLKLVYPTKEGDKIMGLYLGSGDLPQITYWNQDGNLYGGSINAGNLVMAPVGQLDGVDVYPSDILTNSNGEVVPVPHSAPFRVEDWKVPYPTTRMTDNNIANCYIPHAPVSDIYRMIANAAIRHGIDHGYLAPIPASHHVAQLVKHNQELAAATDELCGVINGVAEREYRIARHFISLGAERQCQQAVGYTLIPYKPFTMDEIDAALAQVKP